MVPLRPSGHPPWQRFNHLQDGQDTGIDATEVKPAERLEKLQEILKDVPWLYKSSKQLSFWGGSTIKIKDLMGLTSKQWCFVCGI